MKITALMLTVLMLSVAVACAAELEMKSVESSLLDKVGYDSATKTLVVQMINSSDIYTYVDVPETVYDELLASDSKGTFFVDNIKGKYERGEK